MHEDLSGFHFISLPSICISVCLFVRSTNRKDMYYLTFVYLTLGILSFRGTVIYRLIATAFLVASLK